MTLADPGDSQRPMEPVMFLIIYQEALRDFNFRLSWTSSIAMQSYKKPNNKFCFVAIGELYVTFFQWNIYRIYGMKYRGSKSPSVSPEVWNDSRDWDRQSEWFFFCGVKWSRMAMEKQLNETDICSTLCRTDAVIHNTSPCRGCEVTNLLYWVLPKFLKWNCHNLFYIYSYTDHQIPLWKCCYSRCMNLGKTS